jgi:uncharacterized phage protein gp47/JayE
VRMMTSKATPFESGKASTSRENERGVNMSNTQAQLRFEQAARKQVEQNIAELALTGGEAAIERQVEFLSRVRARAANDPGFVDFTDMLDWALECCYRQHPTYSEAINKFVASIA